MSGSRVGYPQDVNWGWVGGEGRSDGDWGGGRGQKKEQGGQEGRKREGRGERRGKERVKRGEGEEETRLGEYRSGTKSVRFRKYQVRRIAEQEKARKKLLFCD
eukprot:759166-Hanusia_phi.AAC.2